MTRVGVIVVLATFSLACCSKPPTAEQAEAERLLANSRGIAADTLRAAQAEKAAQDTRFALFRSYGKSKAMFEKAIELSKSSSYQVSNSGYYDPQSNDPRNQEFKVDEWTVHIQRNPELTIMFVVSPNERDTIMIFDLDQQIEIMQLAPRPSSY